MAINRRTMLIGAGASTAVGAGVGLYGLSGPGGALVPGVSRARPVAGDAVLPKRVDVVVIGGGFVGCMTALTLAERGISVALCEKGVVAGEASGRSEGLIGGSFLDSVKQPLIARSKQLWSQMNVRVGADTGYRPAGLLNLFDRDEDIGAAEAWLSRNRHAPGVDGRILSAAQVKAFLPAGPVNWRGALFSASDAAAEPRFAAPAMAAAARRAGAHILQTCAVRGIETKAGHVSAVITEKGPIAAQAVVLAGGVWSPVFARSLGLELPQFQAYSSQISIAPIAGPDFSAWGGDVTWRREPDGGYAICAVNGAAPVTPTTLRYLPRLFPALSHLWSELDPVLSLSTFVREWNIPDRWSLDAASPFEAIRILQPEIRDRVMDRVLADLRRNFPQFAQAKERERWAGALVSTLDNMPVISGVGAHPGLYLGTGLYYGLTMGPAAGEALADLIMGKAAQFDLAPYRYERFIDGSKLVFRD